MNSVGSIFIQTAHLCGHKLFRLGRQFTGFESGGQQSRTQGLCEDEQIALLRTVVAPDLVRLCKSRNTKAVLGLFVLNGVSARNDGPGFTHFIGTAGQYLTGSFQAETAREAQQIHCYDRFSTHGIHVAQRIGGRDLAEGVGIVHHRREEIHGLNHDQLIADPVYGGVITAVETYQHGRVIKGREFCQKFAQDTRSQLGCSPTAGSIEGKPQLFIHSDASFPKNIHVYHKRFFSKIQEEVGTVTRD